ncbi:conjugal transfer protein TrbD [Sulfurospirillum cavolei]|uniref:conjugal transfer protein TrbD n=1 Tax=Sulfurospirillum cavolei TaxID=366522 RepID=UPI003FA1D3DE
MESLQTVEIYSALNRPNLIFGCDRELILMSGVIAFALVFSGMTILSSLIGIGILFFNGFFLRMMAKSDPQMRDVFMRQLKYKKFYFARSTPFIKD